MKCEEMKSNFLFRFNIVGTVKNKVPKTKFMISNNGTFIC